MQIKSALRSFCGCSAYLTDSPLPLLGRLRQPTQLKRRFLAIQAVSESGEFIETRPLLFVNNVCVVYVEVRLPLSIEPPCPLRLHVPVVVVVYLSASGKLVGGVKLLIMSSTITNVYPGESQLQDLSRNLLFTKLMGFNHVPPNWATMTC